MPCTDRCHDCGEPLCENQCLCGTPNYSNVGCCAGEVELTNCVNYSGANDTCLDIVKPINLTIVLQKIITYVKNIFNRVTSDSLVITTPNACDDLKIEIVPSTDVNNQFILGTDGKPFVALTTTPGNYIGAGNACLDIESGDGINATIDQLILRTKNTITNVTSDSLSLTRNSGCSNNTLDVEIVPSADGNNIFTLGTDQRPFVPGKPILGSDAELLAAFLKQCSGLGAAPSLSGVGTMDSIVGWNNNPITVAQSLQNLWLTICDMRTKLVDIQDCCSPTVCEDPIGLTITVS